MKSKEEVLKLVLAQTEFNVATSGLSLAGTEFLVQYMQGPAAMVASILASVNCSWDDPKILNKSVDKACDILDIVSGGTFLTEIHNAVVEARNKD